MTKLYECRGERRVLPTTHHMKEASIWREVVEHDVEPVIRLLTDQDDLDALSSAVGDGYHYSSEDAPYVLAWLVEQRPKDASALAMDRCDYHDMMARLWYKVGEESR